LTGKPRAGTSGGGGEQGGTPGETRGGGGEPGRARRRALRRDALHTREVLLGAAGRIIAAQGQAFGLPDVAREAGLGMATVYRHFADVPQLLEEYQALVIRDLTSALRAVPRDVDARQRFRLMCGRWVDKVGEWGPAAVRIRSHRGVLERLRQGDPRIADLYATLEPVIRAMIAEGQIPEQPLDYAVLMWATVLDERLILELRQTLQLTSQQTADRLAAAALAILDVAGASTGA
jgi:AcrR family transcriptional regulator